MLAGLLAAVSLAHVAGAPDLHYKVTATLVRTSKGIAPLTYVYTTYYTAARRDSLGRPLGFAHLDSALAIPAEVGKVLRDTVQGKTFIAPLTGVNAMNFQANGAGGVSMYAAFARMLFVAVPAGATEAWSDSTSGGTLLLAPQMQYTRTKWTPKTNNGGNTLNADVAVTISGEINSNGNVIPVVGSETGNGQYSYDANGLLTSARQSIKGSMSIGGQADIELTETIEIQRLP